MTEDRVQIARDVERIVGPLLGEYPPDGYDCCGCSTYEAILLHAIAVILGDENPTAVEWGFQDGILRHHDGGPVATLPETSA